MKKVGWDAVAGAFIGFMLSVCTSLTWRDWRFWVLVGAWMFTNDLWERAGKRRERARVRDGLERAVLVARSRREHPAGKR